MVILDVAIVNVALPSIKIDLGFSTTSLQWVISAYAILFGGTLLLGGGSRTCSGGGGCSSVGCSSSPRARCSAASPGRRLADRLPRGAGPRRGAARARGAVAPDDDVRGGPRAERALGIYGAASGSGAAAGVLLGGVLTWYLELVVDLLRQRAGRHRRRLLAPVLLRESRAELGAPAFRLRRRAYDHRRADAPRLRADARNHGRLGRRR